MAISMENYDSKNMTKAVGLNLPFSFKVAYEVAKFLKGKKVTRAIRELNEVKEQKTAIPYKRYNRVGRMLGRGSVGNIMANLATGENDQSERVFKSLMGD